MALMKNKQLTENDRAYPVFIEILKPILLSESELIEYLAKGTVLEAGRNLSAFHRAFCDGKLNYTLIGLEYFFDWKDIESIVST